MTDMSTSRDSTNVLSFEETILKGGDERLDIISTGTNKYHVQPYRFKDVFSRGSCTCSSFTPDGFNASKAIYEGFASENFASIRSQHTRRIKRLINYGKDDKFHVFFAPSGSDLCYYQLLFVNLIDPSRKILNIVTCPEELGSGSIAALMGNGYASRNQFGDELEVGAPLFESLSIQTEMLAARNSHGQINNHSTAIEKLVGDYYQSHSINANLVIGSKSGIENNISVVAQVPQGVLWTVDLCQFRATRILINGLLGMNCCVMITGSKFYQSPPFCAALLVPKSVTRKFRHFDKKAILPFAKLFSRHDIPEELTEIHQHLPDYQNLGLVLRWEAALKEMELYSKLDTFKLTKTMNSWNSFVTDSIEKSDFLEAMPGQELTNKTIVSFRVKTADGKYFSHSELVNLYKEICSKDVKNFGPYNRVLFGQPVKYGNKSFIRIAIGASDLRQFVLEGFDATFDSMLIKLIESYAGVRS